MIFFTKNFCGHTVKPKRKAVGLCQQHIGDSPGQTSVAVIKGMDCHEPQMCHSCFQHRIYVGFSVNPIYKLFHHGRYCLRRRSLVMDLFFPHGSGNNLHRLISCPVSSYLNRINTAPPRREYGSMPVEQSFTTQRPIVVSDSIHHHLNHPFRIMIREG